MMRKSSKVLFRHGYSPFSFGEGIMRGVNLRNGMWHDIIILNVSGKSTLGFLGAKWKEQPV